MCSHTACYSHESQCINFMSTLLLKTSGREGRGVRWRKGEKERRREVYKIKESGERELWGMSNNIPSGGAITLPILLCSSSTHSIKSSNSEDFSLHPSFYSFHLPLSLSIHPFLSLPALPISRSIPISILSHPSLILPLFFPSSLPRLALSPLQKRSKTQDSPAEVLNESHSHCYI